MISFFPINFFIFFLEFFSDSFCYLWSQSDNVRQALLALDGLLITAGSIAVVALIAAA